MHGASRRVRTLQGLTVGILAFVLLIAAHPANAAKTDVVVLRNGDRITGEVKELSGGRLRYSTDDLGTVYIEWLEVATLTSPLVYEVETVGDTETVELTLEDIVGITRLDAGFWRRLEGSFDVGFTYTQADTTTQINVDAAIEQRRPNHQTTIDLSGILTDREDAEATRRFDTTFAHLFLRDSRWFGLVLSQVQSNEELGLDLRVLGGGGIGRTAIQTNRSTLRGMMGAAVLEEWASEASDEEIEAFLGGSYSFFTFNYPNTTVFVKLLSFYGLSSDGGVRVEADFSVRRELVKDLYFSVGAYESFDNDTITATAARNDWGLTTSIGWSF
jgi:Protein of unknown function, DUF481